MNQQSTNGRLREGVEVSSRASTSAVSPNGGRPLRQGGWRKSNLFGEGGREGKRGSRLRQQQKLPPARKAAGWNENSGAP